MIGIANNVDQADNALFEMASISLDHSLPVHVQCHICEENPEKIPSFFKVEKGFLDVKKKVAHDSGK